MTGWFTHSSLWNINTNIWHNRHIVLFYILEIQSHKLWLKETAQHTIYEQLEQSIQGTLLDKKNQLPTNIIFRSNIFHFNMKYVYTLFTAHSFSHMLYQTFGQFLPSSLTLLLFSYAQNHLQSGLLTILPQSSSKLKPSTTTERLLAANMWSARTADTD